MIALYLLAAHFVGDYWWQTSSMASLKLTRWRVRLEHVFAYCCAHAAMLGLYAATVEAPERLGWYLLALGALHFLTDSRRWYVDDPWPHKALMVDQTLHLVQIALLAPLLVP